MPEQALEPAVYEMVEAGGRTAETFGLNRLLGQIYTLLYLEPEPISLDALAARMQVSKASCSIACRQLAGWGALRLSRKPGDRRDYYAAETDFGNLLHGGILPSISRKLESAKVQIDRSLELLEKRSDHPQSGFVKRKLLDAERRRARLARLIRNPLLLRMV